MIHIVLPIKPAGQMRARVGIRGRFASVFKAKEQAAREESLAALLAIHRPAAPLDGPLALRIMAYFAVPASKPKHWKLAALTGRMRPTGKPDADNIAKHIKDVMTGVAFWTDDAQVVDLTVCKHYAPEHRLEIFLERAKAAPGPAL